MAKDGVLSNKVTSKTEYIDRKVDLSKLSKGRENEFVYTNDGKAVVFGKKVFLGDIDEEFQLDKEDILDTELLVEKGKLVAKLNIAKEVQ